MPKSQTPNINKGIRRSFQCLLCTQQTCRFIIVGVLATFAMYGMLTALSPLASSVNHTAIDDRSVIEFTVRILDGFDIKRAFMGTL